MPDHVHVVAEGEHEDADMKRFVSAAKQSSGHYYKQAFDRRLWQRYGYDRVLRSNESMKDVVAYVLENPVRAGLVEAVELYPFFRSSRYSREELIEFAFGSKERAG
jgi:REP element-mobilizing transposase RayT